ncbi:MAG: MerR family transcriptional regulator [Candidatus Aminicenantes bacterium]|nr:MerR family transcriptional regulator [Candidatus Aminicenantes bacterium]
MKRRTTAKTRTQTRPRAERPRRAAGEKSGGNFYHISSVAARFNIHPQTLRLYEREGLLKPSRSCGNTRLYSEEDVRRLEIILNLVRDLGVNLAGVEVVLNMRAKMERIEVEVQAFLESFRREFFSGREEEFEARKRSLVPVSSAKIVKVEKAD